MILVTGATGTIGREVIRTIPAGHTIRIMARDPGRVTGAPPTAQIVHGDYTDPDSLTAALHEIHTAFLVTNPDGDDDTRFLQPARAAGVQHIVKLSAAAVADPRAHDLITRRQRHNENLLRHSGMHWTLLRPRAFMSNTLSWAHSIRTEHVVRALYGTSPSACIDPRDVAEVAVQALTEPGHHEHTHTLTGPAPLTPAEQTTQLAELLGRPLHYQELTPQQAHALLTTRHPPDITQALLDSAKRRQQHSKTHTDPTLPTLLKRPARTYHTWAKDHLNAFTNT